MQMLPANFTAERLQAQAHLQTCVRQVTQAYWKDLSNWQGLTMLPGLSSGLLPMTPMHD